ncbi:MAG: hypothetical protein IKO68_10350 [Oscillospiraceae bacterium]|nr:hypothetical protein [Oscillospiraceae bacterium]
MSKAKRAAKKEKKFARMTSEQDIRYRGPLGYRAFKLLGWLCIVLSQAVVMMNLKAQLDPAAEAALQDPIRILSSVADLALPFLLIANFALILNHSEGYGTQLLRYFFLNLLVVGASVFLFARYGVGTLAVFTEDCAQAMQILQEGIWSGSGTGYLAYNIFTDLILCTLLMFFLNYRPEKVFTGKKLILFRCFAALPILYEAASITLKLLSSYGKIQLPLILFPFLTVKPPVTFLVFIVMAVFIKTRELHFRRNGRTHEDYDRFLTTKRNSWNFSVFTAWTLVIAGILDLIFVIVFIVADNGLNYDYAGANFAELYQHASALNLGESVSLLMLAPIMLLFSYTRTHKEKTFDMLIPAIGVVGIVVAYLEGIYQIIRIVPNLLETIQSDPAVAEYLEILLAMSGGMG